MNQNTNNQQDGNEVSDDWKQDFGKKFGFVNNKFTEREMWIIDNVVNKSNTFNEPITDQEIDAEIERYIKQFWPRPEHGGAVRLGFKRAVRWMQERKAIPINFEDDIDTVGNCANCGVEFHIHKQSEEPINNEELKEKFKSVIIEEYGNLVLNSLVKKCVQVAEQYAASKLNKSVVISKHIAKDFFLAGYDYRSSLTPDSIEIFGKNAQPDFEDFLKQYNLESKLNNTIEDKWLDTKPEFNKECVFITATRYNRNSEELEYDYACWQIKKLDGEDENGNPAWYFGLLNGDGEEWGAAEDLGADYYLIIPEVGK